MFFKDNGYEVIQSVFDKSECQRILEIYKSHADKGFTSILNLDRDVQKIKDFITDGRIADIMEHLFGSPMDYLLTHTIFKAPGTDFGKHAWNIHQDNHYNKHEQGKGGTAIIALEDTYPANGGLFVFPGTHKLPVQEHEVRSNFDPKANPGNICIVPAGFDRVDISMNQGDVYVHDGNLMHGSYPNTTDKFRTNLTIVCIIKGQSYNVFGGSKRFPQSLR